jgi:hypothetical protein
MRVTRQGICLWAAMLLFSSLSHAQTVTLEDEYKKLIKVDTDIQPLGANPFGENVSLYDGTLSFEQTDVSVAGTGPLLQVARTLKIIGASEMPLNYEGAFADWELNIPTVLQAAGAAIILLR